MFGRTVSVAALLIAVACADRPATPPSAGPPMTAAERLEYRRNVVVNIVKVTPLPAAAGRPAVVRVFADISNRGNRELGTLQLVVSFRGNGARPPQEETWFPVLVGANYLDVTNHSLAPNETRRFDADFNVPPELATGVDVRVESIQPVAATQLIR